MLKHYLTTALRNFARHKVATGVSIFGLTLGLICLMGAFGFGYSSVNGDGHFANAGRIHFIEQRTSLPTQGSFTTPYNSWLLAKHLPAEFPELEAVARHRSDDQTSGIVVNGKAVFARTSFADAAFLRIFNLPFLAGDAVHALDRPRSAVLTKAAAQRLFGETDVLGRTFVLRGIDIAVTGVLDAIQKPSHLANDRIGIEIMVSSDVDDELTGGASGGRERWSSAAYMTYVLFPKGTALSVGTFNHRLDAFSARTIPQTNGTLTFTVHPISQIMIAMSNMILRGDQTGLQLNVVVMVLGALIAGTACLNYANLATAQIVGRLKEVGLRKVLGAERRHLFAQYLLETGLQVLASYAVALLLLALGYPILAGVLGYNVFVYFAAQPSTWVFLLTSLLVVTFVAGVYPALTVLRVAPDTLARTDQAARGRRRGARVLVGVQFGAVSLLLILALVIVSENRALRQAGLETAGDPIVVISSKTAEAGVSFDALRTELLRVRGVKNVSAIELEPWGLSSWMEFIQQSADPSAQAIGATAHWIGDDFFETMGIKLLAGRTFSADRAEDLWDQPGDAMRTLVIDRALAERLGWTPSDAVGQTLYQPTSTDRTKPPQPVRIVGVVENKPFKFISFGGATTNRYQYSPREADMTLVRLDRSAMTSGMAAIDAAWARLAPTTPLKRRFMDDIFRESYDIFATMSTGIFAVAAFAFCIGAAGLVGMATYAVSRLTREIAIRKALGSTVRRALGLVLWDFSKPVVIANVVAWPLAFLAAQVYLSLFATRIPLTPVPFVLGFLIVLAITWMAVGWHAWRAARVNPAEVLHYE